MVSVRSLEESQERHLRNSMRAYFEGAPGCNLKWIVGVVGSARVMARPILLARFGQYAFTERYRDLISRL